MNTEAVQIELNRLVESVTQSPLKQYPAAKHQIDTLRDLGILDLMPARGINRYTRAKEIVYTDAATVITAAQDKGKGAMNAYGEGEQTGASKLYTLLNEKPTTPSPTNDEILSDVAEYQEARHDEDYWMLQDEVLQATYEKKAERNAAREELKAKIARGQSYHQQNYRVRQTARHLKGVGDGSDIPADALAWRKVSSGYLMTNETYRYEYLVKTDERDLIPLTEAAEILYGEGSQAMRQRVKRLIDDGKLETYADMGVPNPQHRTRVSRTQVEAFKQSEAKDGN